MASEQGWLKEQLEENHREVMRWPPWMVRADPRSHNAESEKPLGAVIVDFLDSNAGKAFTLENLIDHVNAHCGDRHARKDFEDKLADLAKGEFIAKINFRKRVFYGSAKN